MQAAPRLLALFLILALGPSLASAQATPTRPANTTIQTLYLKNAAYPNDLNEILTTIRNMLPQSIRIYSVQAQSAIILEATEEQFSLARQIIDSLDRPRKTYRITYTVTEFDGGKRLSAQHIAIHVVGGQLATLKQGTRVPVITPNAGTDPANPTTQYTSVDVGLNVSATVTPMANGASVLTKFEESSIAPEKAGSPTANPHIQQGSLVVTSALSNGKPSVLGSVDLPGTTHHLEIEALLEPTP